ncbi:DUF4468 domain-containing protein [Chryseobacterium gwangjuense]|uniref:DUF4468 domain-containing protein n=1 Tax=Chryseobacterium gwangjuense TaxID=1069980 RepID=UPI001E308FC0|nr:DUF4468 domain-containing protein [Chryseobacterium gwangjuense]MCE3076739.1 DUF4468 domain-containing protein [Chryseobacterium gwangjuense]
MKKVFFVFALLFINANLFSQQLSYQDTISGTYQSAMIKIAQSYNDASKVIQYKDKEEGIIVLKAAFGFDIPFSWGANKTVDGMIYYSLTITDIGKNQLTIKMDNFEHRSHGSKSFGIITTDEEPNVNTSQTKGWRIKVYNRMREYSERNYLSIKSILNNN